MSNAGTYGTTEANSIPLQKLLGILHSLGAGEIYVKKLSPNDNSKNQPYFGGHLTELSFLPTGEIRPSESVSNKTSDPKRKIKYQIDLPLNWVGPDGTTYDAPNSKLIYYPQYPEVRFSGFLKGSKVDAGYWMDPKKNGRAEGRWLVIGVSSDKCVFAYLVIPGSALANELESKYIVPVSGVFGQLELPEELSSKSTRQSLLEKLLEIHLMGWISGRKLNKDLTVTPYNANNAGGYTLEAMLGIPPNGNAEPDYLGWEVKQFGVKAFPRKSPYPTTLMTPEPNGGFYSDNGASEFIRKFGYPDTSGKVDRLNFSKVHKFGTRHKDTDLELSLLGYDEENMQIESADGSLALIDSSGAVAASWSFAKLMEHWKRKHSQAVYVPCCKQKNASGIYEYSYGDEVELGIGTTFEMFLASIAATQVYYDPGLKLERASMPVSKLKARSQFRVRHNNLKALYEKLEYVDIKSPIV